MITTTSKWAQLPSLEAALLFEPFIKITLNALTNDTTGCSMYTYYNQ